MLKLLATAWTHPAYHLMDDVMFEGADIAEPGCVYGEPFCRTESHIYSRFIEDLIAYWVQDDREEDSYLWQLERYRLHHRTELEPWQTSFDGVAREQFILNRPLFYMEGVAFDAIRKMKIARVRLAGTPKFLFIDVSGWIPQSKNAIRKAIKYGKPIGPTLEIYLDAIVKEYLGI